MKKAITLILICSLLLAFLSGCSLANDLFGKNEQDKEDSIDANVDKKDEAPREEGIPIDKESDVIESIFDYLFILHADYDMLPNFLRYKIDYLKQGVMQPFEITFDKSDYYFICGYDNYTGYPNNYHVDRAKKCNWYRFDCAEDIPEYYNNEKCAYLFQFNKASSIVDMLDTGNVPMIDHFLWILPEFEQGYNVRSPEIFDETIIYLCRTDYLSVWDEGTVYYSASTYYNLWHTIRFVELDGVKYTTILTKEVKHNESGQSVLELSPERELGEYCDYFTDMIEINKYSVDRGHSTDYYSCIKIDDLIKVTKELISDQS